MGLNKVCEQQTSKKYTSRPSPPFPANHEACRGTIKRGQNGKMYVSKRDSIGIFKWVPVTGRTSRRSRRSRTSRTSRTSRKSRRSRRSRKR